LQIEGFTRYFNIFLFIFQAEEEEENKKAKKRLRIFLLFTSLKKGSRIDSQEIACRFYNHGQYDCRSLYFLITFLKVLFMICVIPIWSNLLKTKKY